MKHIWLICSDCRQSIYGDCEGVETPSLSICPEPDMRRWRTHWTKHMCFVRTWGSLEGELDSHSKGCRLCRQPQHIWLICFTRH